MTPINKTAAVVTACRETQTLIERRDALRSDLEWAKKALANCNPEDHKRRRVVGKQIHTLGRQLACVKKQIKGDADADRDLNNYILDRCRERFTKHEWHRILEQARQDKKTIEGG